MAIREKKPIKRLDTEQRETEMNIVTNDVTSDQISVTCYKGEPKGQRSR